MAIEVDYVNNRSRDEKVLHDQANLGAFGRLPCHTIHRAAADMKRTGLGPSKS